MILEFSEISYSEKPVSKVNILMTGMIHPTFIIPNKTLGLFSYSTVYLQQNQFSENI